MCNVYILHDFVHMHQNMLVTQSANLRVRSEN